MPNLFSSTAGVITQTFYWLGTLGYDYTYQNANFKPSTDYPRGISIYCIHGTADRVASFDRIANRLLPKLPHSISSIHLVAFSNRAQGLGIDDFAQQLSEKILANGDANIIVLGHSRGGIVASYYAEHLAQKNNINVLSVMTIGSPFGGAYLAARPLSWFSTSVKQMEINSHFLRELREKINISNVKYVHFAAGNDYLVLPESTFVKNAAIVLAEHGHLSIMSSHVLVSHIHKNIHDIIDPKMKNNLEEDFLLLEQDEKTPIIEIYDDIFHEILKLEARNNANDNFQLQLLINLKEVFSQIYDGENINFSHPINTMDELIDYYMKNYTAPNTIYRFSFFYNFQNNYFLEKLKIKYKDIPLGQLPNKGFLHEKIGK